MVTSDEVVIDCLWDMDATQGVVCGLGLLAHDANRVGGVVSSDVEKVFNLVCPQDLEYVLAIRQVGLVPG